MPNNMDDSLGNGEVIYLFRSRAIKNYMIQMEL